MIRHAFRVSLLLFGGIALLASAPARAADTYTATISANAQTITFTHGLAWIDGKGRCARNPDPRSLAAGDS